jgi:DNA polymerase-1
MAVLRPKKAAVIQKTEYVQYDQDTFLSLHKVPNFYIVDDPQYILDNIHPYEINNRKFIFFDTETHPYYMNSHIVPQDIVRRWVNRGTKAVPQDYPFCLSICDGTNAYVIYDTLENSFVKFKALAPLLEDRSIDKVAHNVKFDMHMCHNAKLKIKGQIHDTVVLAKLVDENRTSYRLEDLADSKVGSITLFEYMVKSYKSQFKITDYRQIPKDLLSMYTCADTWNDSVLFKDEYPKMLDMGLESLYNTECQISIVFYMMERYGMKIDADYEFILKDKLQEACDTAEKRIYEEAKRTFNINSGAQLYKVLIDLGVNNAWIPMTDKGNPSLDKASLDILAEKYEIPLAKNILEFRKYEKLLGTYANGIYEQHDVAFMVHGSINQTEATTGRTSIVKPALQTLPKKDKSIRKCFIPDTDYELWFMDLDQIEYRLFAHYAKAEGLLEAIHNGHDVHAATAGIIFNTALENVTDAMRDKGKTINFSLIYGVGIDKLALDLKCSNAEATELKAVYFTRIPEAMPFIRTVHQVIKIRGFVKNFYGRQRHLSTNDCYKAPNSLIQGCAADYIKSKCVVIFQYLMYNNLKTMLINMVHDELIVNVHKSEASHMPYIRWLFSDFAAFRCPITAGVDKGNPSWGEKIEVEIDTIEPTDKGYLTYDVFNGDIFDLI